MSLVAALRPRVAVIALATSGAVLFGIVSLWRLPSGMYPDVDFPRVVVVARVGDVPPEIVDLVATRPLEEAVITVPGVQRVRSRITRGATELSIQFAPGTDMERALQRIETQLGPVRGELPAETRLQVERVTPAALPIVTFNVSSNGHDSRIRREAALLVIRPALTRVPGVGAVEVQGGDQREIEIAVRPQALADLGLTPSALADRIAATAQIVAVGRAQRDRQTLTVIAASEAKTPAALATLPIGIGRDGPVTLGEVADVFEGQEDRVLTVAGPSGDTAVVTVSRSAGASAPDVVHAARAVVARLLAERVLPVGVRIETVYDQSLLIDEAISGVRDSILVGIGLSLLVLAAFLRNLRAGLAAAIAVPITLACSFGMMRLFGQSLNLMSLGGLAVAIGLVVDDAIVVVEAIVRRLEEGLAVADAVERGTSDLLAAVIGTTVTTVVVFAPLGLIQGVVGSFFGALAITLTSAVMLSLLVALVIVPLLAQRLLTPRHPGAVLATRRPQRYRRIVTYMIGRPLLANAILLALGGAGALAYLKVDSGFLPAMDEGALVVDFFLPQGTSLAETDQIAQRLDRVLVATSGVVTFTRRTGAEMGPATATQQNRGDILVRLAPRAQRSSVETIISDIRERAAQAVPEARVEFVQVLQDVLDDLSGNPRPIEIKIFGPSQEELEQLARQISARIASLAEIEDFFDGIEGSVPVERFDLDAAAALRLGVSPGLVIEDLKVALSGRVVTSVRVGDQSIGVRVRFPDALRFNADQVAAAPFAYSKPAQALSALARLSHPISHAVLTRENLQPVLVMTAAVAAGFDLAASTHTVERQVRGLAMPRGYHLEVGGLLASAQHTQRELLSVFGLGISLVIAVLLWQLRSALLAFVVVLGIPMAIVGALVTLAIFGIPLNASSLMGCVLLAGLVVKNGILLLEHAQHEATTCGDFAVALVRAGERRLRPIVMTSAATIAGLLPLALGWGAGAELQRPLAVATIGGLLVSTALTLLVLPSVACRLMRK